MQPPQQPMGAPQPYYGYPQAAPTMPMVIGKKMIFFVNGLAALLVWIALVVIVGFTLDLTGFKAVGVLYLFGTLVGFGGSLMGALGSPKTNDSQNLGLIVLAGFWLVAMIFGLISAFAAVLP